MSLDQPKLQIQILLVEDDEAVRILLMDILSQEGYTTLSAEDGLEATVLLSEVTPELVITDFNMPRMDGWELAVYVRRHFPFTPVLLVTGAPEGLARAHHPGSPFEAVLGKPFPLNSLLSTIRTLLTGDAETERSPHGPELPREIQTELG